ncbi:MAG: hypothetical protein HY293_09145 [Planctomycetes bacterium]|nr:hypothetical protein [Planctomycetota bacterium]
MRSRLLLAAAALCAAGCAAPSAGHVRLTPEEERILRPLADPPERIRRLVEEGDQQFLKGIPPLRASDPETGSDWPRNLSEALECYTKARSSYLAAQGQYASPQPVPPPLLDRVNETVQRIALLNKRRHAAPR